MLILSTLSYANPLEYINNLRIKSGAFSLHYNKKLETAANKHALYIAKNGQLGHYEDSSYPYFYAKTPWNRITKAGFGTAVVIENISFYERSFLASINKIMGTVYHRLAFLNLLVDSIGYARVDNIYVYDMSNSKIATLCSKHYKNAPMVINSVCPNASDIIPEDIFNKTMHKVKRNAKSIIIYPYRNQKNVPLRAVVETPKLLDSSFGYPVTITFNKSYFSRVTLKEFTLMQGKKRIKGKIVTSKSDPQQKIKSGTFLFAPYAPLLSKSLYHVRVLVIANGKQRVFNWEFRTK